MAKATIEFPQSLRELCQKGWTPQRMKALILSVLRMHFADANKIIEPELQKKIWKSDDSTGILIEVAEKWKPNLTERRPGLILKRNPATILHLGFGGDRMQLSTGTAVGRRIHTDFYQGSHTIFCIGGEGAETEILASEVFNELNGFSQLIRSYMNLFRFMVVEVGEMSLLEEASENFVVPITVGYAWQIGWEITEETAAPFMGIDMSVNIIT